MNEANEVIGKRILEAVLKAAGALSLMAAGWLLNVVGGHEHRLSVIEANRYTPHDALKYERQVNQQMAELHREINGIAMNSQVTREIVQRLEQKLETLGR